MAGGEYQDAQEEDERRGREIAEDCKINDLSKKLLASVRATLNSFDFTDNIMAVDDESDGKLQATLLASFKQILKARKA